MVVDEKFYKRLRLFWWVYLVNFVFNILMNLLNQIGFKILNDYRDTGNEPKEFSIKFIKFLVENGSAFAYAILIVSLIYFISMILLRKYSKGLFITAVIGFILTVLNLINVYMMDWKTYTYNPFVSIIQITVTLGTIALSVLFAVSMMKLVKPFSKKITTLWMVYLYMVIGDIVIRLINTITVFLSRSENSVSVQNVIITIVKIYKNLIGLFPILCLLLTVLMFKKKLQVEE